MLLQGLRADWKTGIWLDTQLHEVASQKHQEEKEEQERLKKQSNVK